MKGFSSLSPCANFLTGCAVAAFIDATRCARWRLSRAAHWLMNREYFSSTAISVSRLITTAASARTPTPTPAARFATAIAGRVTSSIWRGSRLRRSRHGPGPVAVVFAGLEWKARRQRQRTAGWSSLKCKFQSRMFVCVRGGLFHSSVDVDVGNFGSERFHGNGGYLGAAAG